MKSSKIARLLSLTTLVSITILTACPTADSGGGSTAGITPAITKDSLAFKAKSNTVLTLSFNTNVEIIDDSKIGVEVKAEGTKTFSKAPVAISRVNTATRNLLELTLSTAATSNNVYKVRVGSGAIRATASKLTNIEELNSNEFTYSTSPILNTDPYIPKNRIFATFNLPIVLKDWTKVKVYKNPSENNDGEKVPLSDKDVAVNSINRKILEITLQAVAEGEVYRLKLGAGAVNEEGRESNENKAIGPKHLDIPIGPAPALDAETDPYLSRHKIIVPFDGPISILDKKKIRYFLKDDAEPDFGTAIKPVIPPKVVNNNQLEITLNALPAEGQVYRIELDAEAIIRRNSIPSVAIKPNNKDIYSTSPILNTDPHILNNKLVATFNLPIVLRDWTKVKVYKNPSGNSDGEQVPLDNGDIAVNSINRKILEITLTAVKAGEVYRLKLGAGAVNEESREANKNKAIEPTKMDIPIEASPVLNKDKAPFLGQQKIIATFNGPISILDKKKIKYFFKANAEAEFDAAIKPVIPPKVVNNNQLEITLNALPAEGQVYRMELEAGALSGSKNQPSTGTGHIQSEIIVPEITLLDRTPVFASKTEFSVSFPVEVVIHDDNAKYIQVQKKNDNAANFEIVTNRIIAMDDTDAKKINITLTNSEEITPHTQVWKVVFPEGTMELVTSGVINSNKLTTNEVRARLTDS